jgi:hypothetical protein
MQAKLSLVLPICDITGMSVHAVWRRLVGCILALYLTASSPYLTTFSLPTPIQFHLAMHNVRNSCEGYLTARSAVNPGPGKGPDYGIFNGFY